MPRRDRGALILGALFLAGAAAMCRSNGASPTSAAPVAVVAAVPDRDLPPTPGYARPGDEIVPSTEDELLMVAADRVLETKAKYLEGAVYPPWSAPATPSWQPFVDWNQPREHSDDDFAVDAHGQRIQAAVQLDKLYARPGEAITATVVLWRGDRKSQQTPIDFTAEARIQVFDQASFDEQKWDSRNFTPGYISVGGVDLKPVAGKMNTLTGSFVPTKITELAGAQSARFITAFHVAAEQGATIKPLELEFRYAIEEPLVIRNKVSDFIDKDGALVVAFEADVRVTTGIKIEATLFDATHEKPIAVYQDFFHPTSTGKQRVEVKFFGKAVRAGGVAGPYTLQVHGMATDLTKLPADVPWRDDRWFTTAAYALDDLSDADWDDPQKDDMIQAYDRIAGEFQQHP